MQVTDIIVGGNKAKGIVVPLGNANMVIVVGPNGYVMCGYLSIEAADKFGDCAAVVAGVRTVDELLSGKVVKTSSAAYGKGVRPGMTGLEALSKMV